MKFLGGYTRRIGLSNQRGFRLSPRRQIEQRSIQESLRALRETELGYLGGLQIGPTAIPFGKSIRFEQPKLGLEGKVVGARWFPLTVALSGAFFGIYLAIFLLSSIVALAYFGDLILLIPIAILGGFFGILRTMREDVRRKLAESPEFGVFLDAKHHCGTTEFVRFGELSGTTYFRIPSKEDIEKDPRSLRTGWGSVRMGDEDGIRRSNCRAWNGEPLARFKRQRAE